MTKSFSEIVEDCLSEFLKTPCVYNFPDGKIDIRKFAAEHHFLPILLDWSGFYALYPNGEMVVYDFDNFKVSNDEIEPRIRNTAMFHGVKNFPTLFLFCRNEKIMILIAHTVNRWMRHAKNYRRMFATILVVTAVVWVGFQKSSISRF
jgi:hypothetical protein